MNARLLFTILLLGLLTLLISSRTAAQESSSPQPQRSAEVRYVVTDLGTLGGSFSIAYDINNRGVIDGFSTLPGDAVEHSFVIKKGEMTDLGTLGGSNSASFAGLNEKGQVTGASEIPVSDPNNENFCSFFTSLICLGFVWQNGVMTPLDTLGGYNGQSTNVNNRGEISGYAETGTPDPTCPPPQVLQFKPVTWTDGVIQALPLFEGDTEGAAFWINNRGEVVGASGICGAYDPRYALPLVPQHALLWRHGKVIDLGNLGGVINNAAFANNNRGDIVGASDLAGDVYQHAFLWRKGTMHDLGTLSGDAVSAALAINNRRQITGVSIDANGNLRAFLWERGVMHDLNSLITGNSPLYLLHGFGINDHGEIVGFGVSGSGEVHGFLAVPCDLRRRDPLISQTKTDALRKCPRAASAALSVGSE